MKQGAESGHGAGRTTFSIASKQQTTAMEGGMNKKRIAIIGMGCSGITGIKCALDEDMIPVGFERQDYIGGLWYYTNNVDESVACVMKTTVINTSKEMMAYSDFPIPDTFANFMHNTKVMEYFKQYMKHFDLEKYIRFKTEIQNVSPAADYDKTGRWDVHSKCLKTGEETTETYDGVMICTGHHQDKSIPDFEGMDQFEGSITHTHDYKDYKPYENKRCIIVGIGNSGQDVTVELSRMASQVYLSTRRGVWLLPRMMSGGMPFDLQTTRRYFYKAAEYLPTWLVNWYWESTVMKRWDHEQLGIRPKHRFTAQHPTVGDDLPNRIVNGSVVLKPNIRRLGKRSVEFVDGTVLEDIDAIILATGYIFGFPCVKHPALEVKKNHVTLYKYVFPPDLPHGTLSVIGCFQPVGALMPISELQCRWACRVLKGTTKLPPRDCMWMDIEARRAELKGRYVQTGRHTMQVDWVPFMDALAEEIGAKPNIWKMVLRDPKLAWYCFFGPCTPYQYRLEGPNKWAGARQAVLTVWDRVDAPLATRKAEGASRKGISMETFVIGILLAVFVTFLFNWIM